MKAEQIWQLVCHSRPWDDGLLTEARAMLREMPQNSRERQRGVNLVYEYSHRLAEPYLAEAAVRERERVIDRCSYCSAPLRRSQISSDHVVAKSLGGRDGHDNRVPACTRCNSSKGAKPFLQWIIEVGGKSATDQGGEA